MTDPRGQLLLAAVAKVLVVRVVAFPKSPAPPKVFTVTLDCFLMAA